VWFAKVIIPLMKAGFLGGEVFFGGSMDAFNVDQFNR
jgi:hypothetical protein